MAGKPMPREIASVVNLTAHPVASVAALSALGAGAAGQAFGTWMGTMAAATEACLRLWQPLLERQAVDEAPGEARRDVPARQRRAVSAPKAAPPAALRRPPERMARPAAPDDLKAIAGIGPKLEKVLNDQGIWTYRQIAAWSQAEIAWIEDAFGIAGRIGRDGWQAQAAALAGGRKAAEGNA